MKKIYPALIVIFYLCGGLGYASCQDESIVFSTIVYDGWGNPSKPLPNGWNYYAPIPADLQHGGYYAQSFIKCLNTGSEKYCTVAIANRGTTLSITDIYQDFLVLLELTPNYYNNAKDYLDYVTKKMISDGIYKNGVIEVTGHSLGAALADLINTEIPENHKTLANRVYENPGTKNILINMSNSGILPPDSLLISQEYIINIFSAQNAINTTNEQVPSYGNITISYNMFSHEDFSNMNLEDISPPSYLYYFKDYTINQHKIENFYNLCDKYPSFKLNASNESSDHWPVGFFDSYRYYIKENKKYNISSYWNDYLFYAWNNSSIFREKFNNDEWMFEQYFKNILQNSTLDNKNKIKTDSSNIFNLPEYKSNSLNTLSTQSTFAKMIANNYTGNSKIVREIYNNSSIDKKLYYAVITDDIYLGEKLLKEGNANPNSLHGDKKYSLLQISVIMGNLDMIKLLLKYHANPNILNSDGETALHTVAHERYNDAGDFAKVLIEGGVISSTKNKNGATAFMLMQKHCKSCLSTFSRYITP